jgi:2Fe-2S ferredoxin
MVAVRFQQADGSIQTLDLAEGENLMKEAVCSGIEGIDADCGGALACATCHVRFDPEWYANVGKPGESETEMLGFAVDAGEGSRLSCQIQITSAMEGMLVHVPATQR